MLAMYLAYKLFMARDNQHSFNRCVLLLIYLVSFTVYPLCGLMNNQNSAPSVMLSTTIMEIENQTFEPVTSQPVWGTILIWIFITGAFTVVVKTLLTWVRIIHVVHNGEKVRKDGFTLVVINSDKIAPFSWIQYIVVNRSDLENTAIISHEFKHIRSLHWIDLFIAQLTCIINWFNPVAWLMRDELMLVHEYQADMAVIRDVRRVVGKYTPL